MRFDADPAVVKLIRLTLMALAFEYFIPSRSFWTEEVCIVEPRPASCTVCCEQITELKALCSFFMGQWGIVRKWSFVC